MQVPHSAHFLLGTLFSFCYYYKLTDLVSFHQIPSSHEFQLVLEMCGTTISSSPKREDMINNTSLILRNDDTI